MAIEIKHKKKCFYYYLPLSGSIDLDRVRDGERARFCISSNSYENNK
jgi:hypothetical protein